MWRESVPWRYPISILLCTLSDRLLSPVSYTQHKAEVCGRADFFLLVFLLFFQSFTVSEYWECFGASVWGCECARPQILSHRSPLEACDDYWSWSFEAAALRGLTAFEVLSMNVSLWFSLCYCLSSWPHVSRDVMSFRVPLQRSFLKLSG